MISLCDVLITAVSNNISWLISCARIPCIFEFYAFYKLTPVCRRICDKRSSRSMLRCTDSKAAALFYNIIYFVSYKTAAPGAFVF
jgi:hypothetical protein